MIIINGDLPRLHYALKGKLDEKTDWVKKHAFNKTINQKQYVQLKSQAVFKMAITAELKYYANAVIVTNYNLHRLGSKKFQVEATGKAIYSKVLANHNSKIDKNLQNYGISDCKTVPLSPKLVRTIHKKLLRSYKEYLIKAKTSPKYASMVEKIITYSSHFKKLIAYHNPIVAHQAMIDIMGLGIIQRLLDIYPDITKILYNGNQLKYIINGHSFIYGRQEGENSDALRKTTAGNLCNHLVWNYWNRATIDAKHPKRTSLYGYLIYFIKFDSLTPTGYGPEINIINTSLSRIMKLHPSTQSISCDGNVLIDDYGFNNNKHHEYKLTKKTPRARRIIKGIITESINACEYGRNYYQYNNKSNYRDNLSKNKFIYYGYYADFAVCVISSKLTSNHKPLVTLKRISTSIN